MFATLVLVTVLPHSVILKIFVGLRVPYLLPVFGLFVFQASLTKKAKVYNKHAGILNIHTHKRGITVVMLEVLGVLVFIVLCVIGFIMGFEILTYAMSCDVPSCE